MNASSGMMRPSLNIKDQVSQILANSFRITSSAVVSAIKENLGNIGIDIETLSRIPPSTLERLNPTDIQQIQMMHVLIGARDWMESAASAIESNNVPSWMRKCPYIVPKGMTNENFTLCDTSLPKTVAALNQVIYAFLCTLDNSGFQQVPWEQVSINPCFRGMLGIEDPEEYILTAIEGKGIAYSPQVTYPMALHDVIIAGTKAKTWWIGATKN